VEQVTFAIQKQQQKKRSGKRDGERMTSFCSLKQVNPNNKKGKIKTNNWLRSLCDKSKEEEKVRGEHYT
jgi:hypothetical protein